MAGGKATLALEFTVPAVRSPRFLLPRASGGGTRLPALPSPPSRPDLVLDGGIRAKFGGWAGPMDHWGEWVARLRPLHEPLWRELGILEGILASTYRVRRGSEGALLQLVPFWSSETSTFVFPWGEATVTLEDVAALAGLPLVGFPVREPLSDDLEMEDERALEAVRGLPIQRKSAGWIDHFLLRQHQRRPEEEATGAGGGRDEQAEQLLEHGAFLSMWLSRFVLPAPPFGVVPEERVLPIAVRLARGQSVALAPAALASIYSDLSALKRHFVWAKRTDAPSVSAPMHILQLWVWERFPELRPATAAGIPADSAGAGADVPRAARWHEVVGKALDPGYVRAVFAAPKKFEWRPYGSRALPSYARCLHPCELVGMDCVEQHSPHRVARQLGFDQDVPGTVTRLNTDSWEKAWETYDIGAGRYEFAVPSDKPGVTDEYVQWWKPYSSPFEASKRGRSGNREGSSSKLAGNTNLGSSSEVCTKTLYYPSQYDRTKEAWDKDANSMGAASGHGVFHPKRAVGTIEIIKASATRQAEMAELRKQIAKLAKEVREEKAAEPLKK